MADKKGIKLKKAEKGLKPGQIPRKQTINLVQKQENDIKLSLFVPGVIIIVILAALFSKFAVVDRLVAANKAQAEAYRLQRCVEDAYKELEGFGDLRDEYAHYTWSGMTIEELALANREDVMNMIQNEVMRAAEVKSWTINGNQLSIPVSCPTLSQINAIAAQLEKNPLVSFCTVITAATNTYNYSNQLNDGMVTAQITAYLRSPEEVLAMGGGTQ